MRDGGAITARGSALIALAPIVLGAATAFFLTRWLARPGAALAMMDVPNERSLHERPTPRSGGLAVLAGVAVAWGLATALGTGMAPSVWLLLGLLGVAAISLADDRANVPARYRLLVHVAAASLLVLTSSLPESAFPPWVVQLCAVLLAVWMINLYNFMDGMDGFAGGMSVAGFVTLGIAFWLAGQGGAALMSASVAAAAAGFLPSNFPPARIFLGDVGAAPLGFLAAGTCLHAHATAALPIWLSLLVFSAFFADATVTLLRRLLRGERFWEAHRTHYYQRLVQLGWGHRRTVLAEYALMGGTSLTALLVLDMRIGPQLAALAAWSTVLIAAMFGVRLMERQRPRT